MSVTTGQGLKALSRNLIQRSAGLLPGEGEVALNARHRTALQQVMSALTEAGSEDLVISAVVLDPNGTPGTTTG